VVSQGVVELSVNGTMTPVKMERGTEEHVLPLLQYIESQIRQKLVINTPNCLAEAQEMIQWVKDVTLICWHSRQSPMNSPRKGWSSASASSHAAIKKAF
jgi:hypothetical protein